MPAPHFPYPPGLPPKHISARVCEQMPSMSFQPILDAALADYTKQVGIDLATHPLADSLRSCSSPDDVLKLLEDKANQFKDFRDGNRKLLNWLSPVVHVVHTLSTVLGASITLVSRNILVLSIYSFSLILLPGSFRTSKGDFCWRGCSHRSAYPITFSDYISHHIWILQAASGVSSSYDALVDLFECLGNFLKRLRIYTDLPLTPSTTEISLKIMVELLSVLALATKQIKQGRFSKWIHLFDL